MYISLFSGFFSSWFFGSSNVFLVSRWQGSLGFVSEKDSCVPFPSRIVFLLGRDCAGACWPFAEIWCHWWLVQESAWLCPADTTPHLSVDTIIIYLLPYPSTPLHFCSHLSVRVAIPTTLNICAIKSQMMPPCIDAYDVFGMWLCDVLACDCAKQVCVWVRVWCVCFISVLLCPLGIFAHNRFRPVNQAAVIGIRPVLGCKI